MLNRAPDDIFPDFCQLSAVTTSGLHCHRKNDPVSRSSLTALMAVLHFVDFHEIAIVLQVSSHLPGSSGFVYARIAPRIEKLSICL